MPRLAHAALLAITLALAGCGSQPNWQPEQRQELFSATAMRIHPVFTQLRDWSGDGSPDGVEALIEFQDRFGDPAKASGNVVFEIFQYRSGYPDPRGTRMTQPFVAAIDDVASQRDHWNRTSRCYVFQLAWPPTHSRGTYVLTATFENTGGGRFEDRIILQPARPVAPPPATSPARQPGVRNPEP